MFDVDEVNSFLSKLAGESEENVKSEENKVNELESLKKEFEKLFGKPKTCYDSELQPYLGEKLVTKSKYPVHRYYSRWCNTECLKFTKGLARPLVRVKEAPKQPERKLCIFGFKDRGV